MSDELLLIEIERLRQMLEIASLDISKFINCKPSDYLHDLGTRRTRNDSNCFYFGGIYGYCSYKRVIVISSIIWLILLSMGKINPDRAPWIVYLPIAFIECVVYLLSLPKIADFIDRLLKE